jgi:RimJ/RimL family protein N-acetyltransferase
MNKGIEKRLVTIKPAQLNEYIDSRELYYSKDSLEFDDPDRPIPTIAQESEWWKTDVESKKHIIFTIYNFEMRIIGFIHAFSFEDNTCETGITIFPKECWNKGYASSAYSLFIPFLENIFLIKSLSAEVNERNTSAIMLYSRLGFKRESTYNENSIIWVVMKKYL